MQGSMWKVATFVAILGVGGLIAMQVQSVLSETSQNENITLDQFANQIPNSVKKAAASEKTGSPPLTKVAEKVEEQAPSGNPFGYGANNGTNNGASNFSNTESTKTTKTGFEDFPKVVKNQAKTLVKEQPVAADPWAALVTPVKTEEQKKTPGFPQATSPRTPVVLFDDVNKNINKNIKTVAGAVSDKVGATKDAYFDATNSQLKNTQNKIEKNLNTFTPPPTKNPDSQPGFMLDPPPKPFPGATGRKTKIQPSGTFPTALAPLKETSSSKGLAPQGFPFPASEQEPAKLLVPKETAQPRTKRVAFQSEPKDKEDDIPPSIPIPNFSQPDSSQSGSKEEMPTPVRKAEPLPAQPSPAFPFLEKTPTPKPVEKPSSFIPLPEKRLEAESTIVPLPGTTTKVTPAGDELVGIATLHADSPRGVQRPEMQLEKVAPKTATLGQPMIYEIIVRNTGTVAAHQVIVQDQIPRGSRLEGTSPQAQLQAKEKKLLWRLGTFKPGTEKRIKVRVTPIEEGDIGSVTTVNFVTEIAAKTRITAPKLVLSVKSPKQSVVGENVAVTYTVQNIGKGKATGVVLRSLLPEHLSHQAGKDLEYDVGEIPAGESRKIHLTMKAIKKGDPISNALIEANGGITAKTSSTVNIIKSVLTVTRKGPARRFVGRDAVYTMKIQNHSVRALNNLRVTETVPIGMKFLEASHGGFFNENTRTVTWQIAQVGVKGESDLSIKLKAITVGNANTAVLVVDSAGNQADLKGTTRIEGFASLAIHEVKGKGPVAVGERVSWKFHLKNRGSAKATNVLLQVVLPNNLKFVSANGPTKHNNIGQVVNFTPIASLNPGQETTVDLVMTAAAEGNSILELGVKADQMKNIIKHQETVIIYDESQ